jgi:hypothetical protein
MVACQNLGSVCSAAVRHCFVLPHTTGFLLYRLSTLPWFTHTCKDLTAFAVACITASNPCDDTPDAWSAPPRKQLPATVLHKRANLQWDIPRADVKKLFPEGGGLTSTPIYVAGTGVRLNLQINKQADAYELWLGSQLTTYMCDSLTLTSGPSLLSCKYVGLAHT